MKLLITGGAGFIGSQFVNKLALRTLRKTDIVIADSLTYAGDRKRIPGLPVANVDISDQSAVDCLFEKEKISNVINFAAETHVDRSISSPAVFARTNIMGTLNLLNAAMKHGVDRFLQVSTDEVYGSLDTTGRFTEDTPICPSSPYSASKAAADLLVMSYHHTYGLNVCITRCSNNYGPWQYPEKLIPLMIYNALKYEPLPVYGDGMNIRDWVHVEDHCSAIWRVFVSGRPGRVYNIGGDCEKTNIEIVRTILHKLRKPETMIKFVTDRSGHDRRYAMDSSRIRLELGWQPCVDFEIGLSDTITWYRKNMAWMEKVITRSKR